MNNLDIDNLKTSIEKTSKYTKNLEILVVEDHEILLNSLKNFLCPLFKSVDIASNGEEAIELYKKKHKTEFPYDIIFSDIQMPKMDGITLTKNIYKINSNENIVIFSAHHDTQYMLELVNLGIRRFISKPIEFTKLITELELICSSIFYKNSEKSKNILKLNSNTFFYKDTNILCKDELPIKLTSYELLLLKLLMSKMNLIVTFDEILNYFYSNMIDINYESIRKLMYNLRKKIPEELIQSVYSIGYRMVVKE